MGIDTVALLRIPALESTAAEGLEIEHREDCSVVHTFVRYHGTAPDEHALMLRQALGESLDTHDDPRGILVFPDLCAPRSLTYEAIVREVGGAGTWAPMVGLDYVPRRYAEAPEGSHEQLVARMIARMGRDRATTLDTQANIHLTIRRTTTDRPDAVEAYAEAIAEITAAMGLDFATRYEQSLGAQVDAVFEQAQRGSFLADGLLESTERDEPWVTPEQLAAFLQGDGGRLAMQALDAALRDELVTQLESADLDALPRDDLAHSLAVALGVRPAAAPAKKRVRASKTKAKAKPKRPGASKAKAKAKAKAKRPSASKAKKKPKRTTPRKPIKKASGKKKKTTKKKTTKKKTSRSRRR